MRKTVHQKPAITETLTMSVYKVQKNAIKSIIYSTVTDCFSRRVYSKPQSYFANQIDFLEIITELKEKHKTN